MAARDELEPMVAACVAVGVDPEIARELCSNAIGALDYPPPRRRRDAIVRSMIEHRQQHWPQRWAGVFFDELELARSIVQAYDSIE